MYIVHVNNEVVIHSLFFILFSPISPSYSGIIAMGWTLYIESCKTRRQLKESRDTHLKNYRSRLLALRERWSSMGHRVIIHLPSRGTVGGIHVHVHYMYTCISTILYNV